jgi:hypothetical protein
MGIIGAAQGDDMRKTSVLVCSLFIVIAGICVAGQEISDSKKNEQGAVGAIRTINTAQLSYAKHYSEIGFACDIAHLGTGAEKDKPQSEQKFTAQNAGLIDDSLAVGHADRKGYRYEMRCPDPSKPQSKVEITAVPLEVGKTGQRAFCSELHMDGSNVGGGVIWLADDGQATSCWKDKKAIQ